jgi:hypothetical protein
LGADRAELRDRDLEVGQQLEEKRLELLVRLVDLVDEQHRATRRRDGRSSGRSSRYSREKTCCVTSSPESP